MSETKRVQHTPGPWFAVDNLKGDGNPARVTVRVPPHGQTVVAQCYGADSDAEANARLIAQAPAMYDELQRMKGSLVVLRLQKFADPDVRKLLEEMFDGAAAILAAIDGK